MARMYPPQPAASTKSTAEFKLFEWLRGGLGENWSVLHSVGLAYHNRKPWAEIDFVVVGPPGIFCLEVKGGRVARVSGEWQFTDRLGHTTTKQQGPFDQVAGAAAALRRYLIERLQESKRVVVGYGVAMPDIVFDQSGPDILPPVILDQRDSGNVSDYLARLADYWHGRLSVITGINPALHERIVEELRGDFEFVRPLSALISDVDDELLALTKEQYRVLDLLADNPRVLIRGSAGTGKTLLAMEECRRFSDAGLKVLFCCFNRNLASFVRTATASYPNLVVQHLHGLMEDVLVRADMKSSLPAVAADDLLQVIYPEMCCKALKQLREAESYDVIIVDEAQDLLLTGYADVMDMLLKGGLSSGQWTFFLDHNQDLFAGSSDQASQRLLAANPARATLTVNCRNTAPIGSATVMLSSKGEEQTLGTDGPAPGFFWSSSSEEMRRDISRNVGDLIAKGITPEQMVILSPRRLQSSCLAQGFDDLPYPLRIWEGHEKHPTAIRFSTLAAFKGLESDVVLLIDIDDFSSSAAKLSLYVGASRARAV